MQYSALCSHNELRSIALLCIREYCSCRTDEVGKRKHSALAFGVREYLCVGMSSLQFHNFLYRELFMDMTAAIPQKHIAVSYCIKIASEVLVRSKYYLLVLREALHYGTCIG